jgi:hypothetical protein
MVWATANQPWQLITAALLTGCGWVTLGAAAINAIITPWYATGRPMALAKAYNGASVGGVIFSSLWVGLIAHIGFFAGAVAVGLTMVLIVGALCRLVFTQTPAQRGETKDGGAIGVPTRTCRLPMLPMATGESLWRDRQFLTLAGGMAMGLFAQIGLLAHLYGQLVPRLGLHTAGWSLSLATASAIAGRYIAARTLSRFADRRIPSALSYGIQLIGSLCLLATHHGPMSLIFFGILLFGLGIGNATSLPPLIAQSEFAEQDVPRVVALIVAISQGFYALAPAFFALLMAVIPMASFTGSTTVFAAAALIQAVAVLFMLVGRLEPREPVAARDDPPQC